MIRQNFYNGQKVAPKNLNDLQSYVEGKNADLVSSILGYGIINGFSVQKESEMIVSVNGGLAYTEEGVRLFSETGLNITIPSSELPNAGDRTVSLALRFDWNKTGSAIDSTGSAVTTSWIPTVLLKLGNEILETDLKIADIKLSPVGILEIIENGQQFLNFEQQVVKTKAFSTETTHETTTANISADILNLNTDINIKNKTFEDTIRDMVYPVGCTYVQYPNPSTGQFESNTLPTSLFGGIWELRFNDKGVFFRTEGGNSSEARDGSTGIQQSALQNHTHDTRISGNVNDLLSPGSKSYNPGGGNRYYIGNHVHRWVDWGNKRSGSPIGVTTTGLETRPVNMLKRIWQRIA